ncbi:TIGR01777 family oxidoreductase [Candidatus Nitrotoga arctica]|uniref:Epimerase family protein YfcH n=1 Tax=Candidatus Nitrotoga arctica TaxID=453162 RepID=A0ABM8Z1M3_9PROT|nr:TIGR01777 family oxidoreductase [Candidatus Nitrotoga arctica]CAG9933809.1 Epimerase family protein YfcH [Candidatus Nitrotoga arctica]
MKILITGGTGLIGQTLCPALLAAGHTLRVYSRHPDKVNTILGDQVTPLNSLKTLSESDYFEAIINLAGAPIFGKRWTDERKRVLLHSRIDVTQDLVKFIARAQSKPEVFLSGSAIGFYGNQGHTILDETSPGQDDFGRQPCVEWENEAVKAKEHGVRVCQLRTGLVVGKNGGFLQPMILPFKLGLGGQLGSGEQWMPWIHIDDHVAICLALLNSTELNGPFNLTAPNPVTNHIFAQTLAKTLHRPAFLPAPAWILKLLLGEMSELLLGSQRVIPRRMLGADYQFKFTELGAALRQVLCD